MRWSTAALWSLLFNALFVLSTHATESDSASIGIPTAPSSDERTSSSDSRCDSHKRREWRSLAPHERNDYLKAVQCIQNHKSTAGIPEARTRFDDFQGHHILVSTRIHLVGQFLPWHRWFLRAFEVALREECNFAGSLPYWDWTKDADPSNPAKFTSSPVFDALEGFGNLPLVQGPLSSGAFAKYRLIFGTGPPPNVTDHLIERGFDVTMLPHLTEHAVKSTLNMTTFETFRIELEGRPITVEPKIHDSGHLAVGGDMANPFNSPG
ncbi:hypothetical protein H0H93_008492, partial [Arthromyces matolae]